MSSLNWSKPCTQAGKKDIMMVLVSLYKNEKASAQQEAAAAVGRRQPPSPQKC